MDNQDYTEEFDPFDYQADFFPGMADFIDGNIVAGDKDGSDRLNASYWDDLGNDVFDDWGYFYLYDVENGKYYFPLINPQNQDDGIITTQTFNAFGRTFTIKHGWIVKGVFKFDISVADALQFRFGAYGNMGSDGDEITKNLTHIYTIDGNDRILHYRFDAEEDDDEEILYSYFIPKNNSENNTRPYDVYYDDDDMSMVSKELTTGLTVYFGKSYDVRDIVVKDFKYISGEGNGVYVGAGRSTGNSAIVSGENYTILQKMKDDVISDLSNTITINSTTGVISTTSSTELGTYTIYVRNNGSYNISEYTLIVAEGSVVNVTDVLNIIKVLNRKSNFKRDDYNVVNYGSNIYAGNPNRVEIVKSLIKRANRQ